ncbi:MAG: ATP-binding cassette domain-containing protein [Aureispira sp.]|nr:ATP-binding cassette domain-containing protein [Aureispira sp.]
MNIKVENISKRYRLEWIFKDFSYEFKQGKGYAILGRNGSGKSTLMQILSGYLSPSKGKVYFLDKQKSIDKELVYKNVSYAGPYIDLIEEFTFPELLKFHSQFKQMLISPKEIKDLLAFPKMAYKKPIKFFSSGMLQRVKLILSICSTTPILLLDEPTITLDQEGIEWYQHLVDTYGKTADRLLIVASNAEQDYRSCEEHVLITDYKK